MSGVWRQQKARSQTHGPPHGQKANLAAGAGSGLQQEGVVPVGEPPLAGFRRWPCRPGIFRPAQSPGSVRERRPIFRITK
jgi:hypothetical protein